ncbi:hypothetical protein ESZ00_01890 [Silvibacterium dinghuense]|uniref:Uncharacterized protein n=2 Tax=Silvibacterium dinghuense TaxID=1560006 RepID=A0A4V1NW40_9BACT|nr:hypothetical protein ESZ00_01890 [Silvibacterium dinghuense]
MWNVSMLFWNILGAVVYLVAASHGWVIPAERDAGIHAVTGEPFVWFAAIAPVLALFLLTNLIWVIVISVRRQWKHSRMWFLGFPIWITAIIVDFAHHG